MYYLALPNICNTGPRMCDNEQALLDLVHLEITLCVNTYLLRTTYLLLLALFLKLETVLL